MCGCGKKSNTLRTPAFRPSVGPRPTPGGIAAGASPETLRAMRLQSAISPKTAVRLDAERLNMMKRRREAIKAKFNK
jgi:hypothetical protein